MWGSSFLLLTRLTRCLSSSAFSSRCPSPHLHESYNHHISTPDISSHSSHHMTSHSITHTHRRYPEPSVRKRLREPPEGAVACGVAFGPLRCLALRALWRGGAVARASRRSRLITQYSSHNISRHSSCTIHLTSLMDINGIALTTQPLTYRLISHHPSHTTHHTTFITQPLVTQPLISCLTPFSTDYRTLITQHSSHNHSFHTTHFIPFFSHHSSHTASHTTHHTTAHPTSFISHHSSPTAYPIPHITRHSSHTKGMLN